MKHAAIQSFPRNEATSVVPLCAAAFTIPPIRLRDLIRAERKAAEAKAEDQAPKRDEKSED